MKKALPPAQIIPKIIATSGLLAHVLGSKYRDNLQDQNQKLQAIPYGNQDLWQNRVANILEDLSRRLKRLIVRPNTVDQWDFRDGDQC